MAAKTAAVKTGKVTGRRTVRYGSFDDLRADLTAFEGAETRTLGNWSEGQIYKHLALSFDMMANGPAFMMPAPLRWAMRTFMKRRMLSKGLPAGFQAPKRAQVMIPDPIDAGAAREMLRRSIDEAEQATDFPLHPVFGPMTRGEWIAFELRHAELHMSFIVPTSS